MIVVIDDTHQVKTWMDINAYPDCLATIGVQVKNDDGEDQRFSLSLDMRQLGAARSAEILADIRDAFGRAVYQVNSLREVL